MIADELNGTARASSSLMPSPCIDALIGARPPYSENAVITLDAGGKIVRVVPRNCTRPLVELVAALGDAQSRAIRAGDRLYWLRVHGEQIVCCTDITALHQAVATERVRVP